MSVAGSGGGDGIQLVDIRLVDDSIAVASGGGDQQQQQPQTEKNSSRAR
jgi:hypothetical protein